ncbi:hypothetical protein DZB84_20800 [Bacillus sp. HNG]|uniref:hypothetical protein n=1 Tax=Bacillus sp. HNG TaxID=2293325 RepID=UPI000E2EDBD7|nr:hypothetical protein [Bacillus sp. HNG]RFB11500.1 hypothetical protein DZB84_20800 [Bacillus sp. HNG]
MKYENIQDHQILNYEVLKIVIFEETKKLFEDRPYIIEKWKREAYNVSPEERLKQFPDKTIGPSFRSLISLFTQTLYYDQYITKKMIKDAVEVYKETIKVILAGQFINEFPDDEIKRSFNEDKINETLNLDYIYSSMDYEFHLMRDIVTKKKDFKEGDAGYLTTEIIDNRGKVRGFAELRPYESQTAQLTSEQNEVWLELIESTINSLDELTADLFDLITYLWMVSPKNPDGYIEFHSNDALQIRNLKKRTSKGREHDYREEDRFNIMRRVAALSSIWISLGDRKVKIVNTQNIDDNELYKFKDFQRMFELGQVRVAYDKKSGEAKGIYAVQIKPTAVLTPYLVGPNRSLGLLDLKVFQYSHYTQREHKRLTRYLNLQWKIRTIKRTLKQPFKISTILKAMDLPSRLNGLQIRDKFENTLDELQKDGVIKHWSYNVEVNESLVGKKGWFKEYWTKLNVIILPPEIVVKENQKNTLINSPTNVDNRIIERMYQVDQQDLLDIEEQSGSYFSIHEVAATIEAKSVKEPHHLASETIQQTFDFGESKNISLTPEAMKETIDNLGKSIRQAAKEIGIAHTTLSRFIRGENKRQNKNNDEKMLNWLIEMSNNFIK